MNLSNLCAQIHWASCWWLISKVSVLQNYFLNHFRHIIAQIYKEIIFRTSLSPFTCPSPLGSRPSSHWLTLSAGDLAEQTNKWPTRPPLLERLGVFRSSAAAAAAGAALAKTLLRRRISAPGTKFSESREGWDGFQAELLQATNPLSAVSSTHFDKSSLLSLLNTVSLCAEAFLFIFFLPLCLSVETIHWSDVMSRFRSKQKKKTNTHYRGENAISPAVRKSEGS